MKNAAFLFFLCLALLSCGKGAQPGVEEKAAIPAPEHLFGRCPDTIDWLYEYLPLEKQKGNAAFSWEVLYDAHWAYPPGEKYQRPYTADDQWDYPWQTSEATLRNALWPHLFFGPTVDSVLVKASKSRMGVNAISAGDLTYMFVWRCLDYMLLCVDADHRVWNVDFRYGLATDSIHRPMPACSGGGCALGEKNRELSKSEVIEQIQLMDDGVYHCYFPCPGTPEAKPRLKLPPADSARAAMLREMDKILKGHQTKAKAKSAKTKSRGLKRMPYGWREWASKP